MAISQEEIIGLLLPYVSINRITLETSGITRKEDNPHIDSPLENPVINTPDSLRISLDLFLKDVVDDDQISTWFSQQDFSKYINLKIFQSRDPRVTSLLSVGREMISLVDPDTTVSDTDTRMFMLMAALKIDDMGEARKALFKKVEYRKLSLKNDMMGSKSKLSQHGGRVDSDGNKVFEVNYRINFETPESAPEHLAYFAMTTFDIEALAKDFNLDFQTANLYRMNGNLVSETVIENYIVNSKSFVYYDREGKVWNGPIHKVGEQLKTGYKETSNSRNLKKAVVMNTKVQDFRISKAIEQIKINFSDFKNPILSNKIRNNDKMDVYRSRTYFSDAFLATDEDGINRFIFAVDIKKLITYETVYGALIKNMSPAAFDEVVRDTRILSINVWRRRIKRVERFKTDPRSGIKTTLANFDLNNDPDCLIVTTGEKSPGKIRKIENDKASIRESQLLARNADGIRFFTGVDRTSSTLNRGQYQYGVEIEIDDGSVRFFQRQLRFLRNAEKDLLQYYNEAVKPSQYFAKVNNPHIDHPSEYSDTRKDTLGAWNPQLRRFSQSFIKKIQKQYPNRRNAPWVKSVSVYLNALNLFSNLFVFSEARKRLILGLGMYVNPKTATPESINSVIKLIQSLSTKLGEVLKATQEISGARKKTTAAQDNFNLKSGRNNYRSIKVKEFLYGIFNAQGNNKPSWEYINLGKGSRVFDGLTRITGAEYRKRVNVETTRYFGTLEPDINMKLGDTVITENDSISNTSFAFLSPTVINLSGNPVSLIEESSLPTATTSQFASSVPIASASNEMLLEKKIRGVGDFKISAGKKYSELQATILYQNSSDTMVNPTPSNAALDSQDPTTVSDSLTNNAMGSYLATSMNLVIEAVNIETEETEEGVSGLNFVTPTEPFDVIAPCSGDIVDKLVDVGEKCATEQETTAEQVNIPGANTFLHSMVNVLAVSGVTTQTIIAQPAINQTGNAASGARRGARSRTKLGYFNLNNLTSTQKRGQVVGTSGIISGNGYKMKTVDIKRLPNPLKSLYLTSVGSPSLNLATNTLVNSLSSNANEALKSEAEFTMKFGLLSRVEFLSGFKKDVSGETMMSEEIWAELTERRYNRFVGKEVLCRLREYENRKLGINLNKGLKTSVTNEYFIVVPEKKAKKPPASPLLVAAQGVDLIRDINADAEITFGRSGGSPLSGRSPSRGAAASTNNKLNSIMSVMGAIDCETQKIIPGDSQTMNLGDSAIEIPGVDCLDSISKEQWESSLGKASERLASISRAIIILGGERTNLIALPPEAFGGTTGRHFARDLERIDNQIASAESNKQDFINQVAAAQEKLSLPNCPAEINAALLALPITITSADPCEEEAPRVFSARDAVLGITPAGSSKGGSSNVSGVGSVFDGSSTGEEVLNFVGQVGAAAAVGGAAGAGFGAGAGALGGAVVGGFVGAHLGPGGAVLGTVAGATAGAAIGAGLGHGVGALGAGATAAAISLSDEETQEALVDCASDPSLCAEDVEEVFQESEQALQDAADEAEEAALAKARRLRRQYCNSDAGAFDPTC